MRPELPVLQIYLFSTLRILFSISELKINFYLAHALYIDACILKVRQIFRRAIYHKATYLRIFGRLRRGGVYAGNTFLNGRTETCPNTPPLAYGSASAHSRADCNEAK